MSHRQAAEGRGSRSARPRGGTPRTFETLSEAHSAVQHFPRPAGGLPATAKHFRDHLRKSFGSLELAWQALAGDSGGEALEFPDFAAGCCAIGFRGKLRGIFSELTGGAEKLAPGQLDRGLPEALRRLRESAPQGPTAEPTEVPGHGRSLASSTLGEIEFKLFQNPHYSSKAARPVADVPGFLKALVKKFGRLEYAWDELDTNESGEIAFAEFVQGCRRMSFQGCLRKIFRGLTNERGLLLPEALDPALPAALLRLRAEKESRGWTAQGAWRSSRSDGPEGITGGFQHGRPCSLVTMGEVAMMLHCRPDGKAGPPSDAKGFRRALAKKFDRLDHAWEVLDSNGNGRLDFGEFVHACRRIEFAGNLRKIFGDLAQGGDVLTPDCVHPALPAALEALRRQRAEEAGGGERAGSSAGGLDLQDPFSNAMITHELTNCQAKVRRM